MKKLSPQNYAKAFLAALEEPGIDANEAVKRFIAAVRRRNDWSRRNEILSVIEAKWRAKQGKSLLTIESARPLTRAQRESLAKRWSGATFDVRETTNPSLIAGVKLVVNGERQLDGSLNRKLRDMFSET